MNWRGTKVLVTGAGGFIGSHLTERLVALGARTRAFVHYNALGQNGWLDSSEVLDQIDIVRGDIRDRDTVDAAIKGVDVVFHLAALIAIPYSYQTPISYVRTNVEGTLNVLDLARAHGVQRVIHTSTSEVYGTAQYVPIDEKHPLQGQSPYSASKISADKMAEAFYCSFNLPVVTVRPFNTFGPRQSARAIIPTIISQCLAGHKLKLGNLAPTRDLNYVTDTVEGFVLAASTANAVGKTVNLGSGRETSIGDLATLICNMIGTSFDVSHDPLRDRPEKSEVERLNADNKLAKSLLGWQPAVVLEEGIRHTIDWIRLNPHVFKPGSYVV